MVVDQAEGTQPSDGSQVCLSISSHHPEHWQPSWSVRTALVALVAFMQTPGGGAIAALVLPPPPPSPGQTQTLTHKYTSILRERSISLILLFDWQLGWRVQSFQMQL